MTIADDITEKEADEIHRDLIEFNAKAVPLTGPHQDLCLALRDDAGALQGGLVAFLHGWHILFIDYLWIAEAHRHQGYASRLLQEVERVARQKGCRLIQLDTFDFQAPGLYERNGYKCFAVLDDCPPGHKRYYFKKVLL